VIYCGSANELKLGEYRPPPLLERVPVSAPVAGTKTRRVAEALVLVASARTSRFWTSCGNCDESLDVRVHTRTRIWQAASQPASAVEALRRVIAGEFSPLKLALQRDNDAWQKDYAAQEARLVLAEILVKQTKNDEALKWLDDLAKAEGVSRSDVGKLASAHAKRLREPSPSR
jgi:hypothetical protein